jgi:hypothetical protein
VFFPLDGDALSLAGPPLRWREVGRASARADDYFACSDGVGIKVAGRRGGPSLEIKVGSPAVAAAAVSPSSVFIVLRCGGGLNDCHRPQVRKARHGEIEGWAKSSTRGSDVGKLFDLVVKVPCRFCDAACAAAVSNDAMCASAEGCGPRNCPCGAHR